MMMAGDPVKKKHVPRKVHDEETLTLAIQVVWTGHMSIRAASLKYGLPKSTLADKVCGNTSTQRKGPTPFLGWDIEDCLATWLTKMAHIRYGQTRDMLFDKVQDIVARSKIPTLFTNGRPSKQWYYLFMKWHPYLGIQQAQ